jgi:hypothetical protein
MTAVAARRGAFGRRLTIEFRNYESKAVAQFAVKAAGVPVTSDVRLEYSEGEQRLRASEGNVDAFPSLQRATFERAQVPEGATVRELKVWAHRVTPDGESNALAARAAVNLGDETKHFDLGLTRGQALISVPNSSFKVDLALGEGADS